MRFNVISIDDAHRKDVGLFEGFLFEVLCSLLHPVVVRLLVLAVDGIGLLLRYPMSIRLFPLQFGQRVLEEVSALGEAADLLVDVLVEDGQSVVLVDLGGVGDLVGVVGLRVLFIDLGQVQVLWVGHLEVFRRQVVRFYFVLLVSEQDVLVMLRCSERSPQLSHVLDREVYLFLGKGQTHQ